MTTQGRFVWHCTICGSSAEDSHFYADTITRYGHDHRCTPSPKVRTLRAARVPSLRVARIAGFRHLAATGIGSTE